MFSNLSGRLAGLKQQLMAEKKKVAILGGLSLVLVVVCARQFFGSSTPEEAVAIIPPSVPPPSLAPTVVETKSTIAPSPARTAIQGSSIKSVEVAAMPRELARDLFDTKGWGGFRPAISFAPRNTLSTSQPNDGSLWQAALLAIAASQKEQRKESLLVNQQLAELKLQSTMTGALPMAYISGRLVKEGEAIEGFAIEHISDRRVVVRKGPFIRELIMP